MKNTVKFIFDEHPELILECEEKNLEASIARWKRTLKLTYNAKYDIVPNDYTVTSFVDDSPSNSNADQPAALPKNTKSTKSRKKADDVQPVFEFLDINPDELTGLENGSDSDTISKSDDGIPS